MRFWTVCVFGVGCGSLPADDVAGGLMQRVGAPVSQAVTRVVAPPDVTAFGRSVASGDFDGDGVPELAIGGVAADGTGVVTVWDLAGASPALLHLLPAAPAVAAVGNTIADVGDDGRSLAAADVDGDGFDDLVAGDPSFARSTDEVWPYGILPRGRVVVYLGGPAGLGGPTALEGSGAGVHLGGALLALGDVDGDGRGDVLTSHAASNWESNVDVIAVMHGRADGRFDADPVSGGAVSWPDLLGRGLAALGDVDGDGRDDLGWTLESWTAYEPTPDAVELRWVAGAPNMELSQSEPWSLSQLGDKATLRDASGGGDLDLDGAPDLVAGTDNSRHAAAWYANTGGTFGLLPAGELRFESSDWPVLAERGLPGEGGDAPGRVVAAGDVDGDGVGDLVALATEADELLVYRWSVALGGPDEQATDVRGFLRADLGQPKLLVPAGDLDGDGRADLVIADDAGLVHVVWGDGPEGCAPGAAPTRWFLDDDGDGYASDGHARLACVQPPGAAAARGADCDDADPAVNPGGVDAPGVDGDCDGALPCLVDADRDGWGAAATVRITGGVCDPRWAPIAPQVGDCDDAVARAFPGGVDWPGQDNDCDGSTYCFVDADDDGHGEGTQIVAVAPGARDGCGVGLATSEGDCDDLDAAVWSETHMWWQDRDDDGYGDAVMARGCHGPAGYAARSGDCDDNSPIIHPGRVEVAGGVDDDCDGVVACYDDRDGDDYGSTTVLYLPETLGASCVAQPAGGSFYGDCDDANPAVSPGLGEDLRTAFDDNCNGSTRPGVDVRLERIGASPRLELVVDVVDFDPRTPVSAVVSLVGPGAGPCPAALRGACLSVLSPRFLSWDFTDAGGSVDLAWQLPAQVSRRTIWVQVISAGRPAAISPVFSLVVP